jgi:hypothetical protein
VWDRLRPTAHAHVPAPSAQACTRAQLMKRRVPREAEVRLCWVVYVVHMIGKTFVCTGHEVVDRHLPFNKV